MAPSSMRLHDFLDQARERILAESVAYAATLPVLGGESLEALRDHLPLVLDAIARDLEQPQSRAQSIAKSQGLGPATGAESAAQTHGALRARSGLTIEQLVAEYRVLRSSVLRLWADAAEPDEHVLADTMRFNEAIDQAVAESVAFHAAELERWRAIFLGVLGHDLRGPLNAMLLTAEVLRQEVTGAAAMHAQALLRNGRRLEALLDSLLEYNKSRLGVGMAIDRSRVDVAHLCRQEVRLLHDALPDVAIVFDAKGDTNGDFDGSRVREALANLVFNAAQHSTPAGTPITITLRDRGDAVEVSTENESDPIPPDVLQGLFEPLRRRSAGAGGSRRNLGLGLFIVREIARAHGGDASVAMTGRRVRFTIVLPKAAPAG